jgi:hypothetical protein
MQFQVPQFIETEDKIIGPFTLRQFLYIAAATAIAFLLYLVLAFWLWLIVALVIESAAFALALLKINGRPMTIFSAAAFSYIWSPRVYTFQAPIATTPTAAPVTVVPTTTKAATPGFGQNLRNLLDKLTTSKEAIPQREQPLPEVLRATARGSVKERYTLIRKITGEGEIARRIDYR